MTEGTQVEAGQVPQIRQVLGEDVLVTVESEGHGQGVLRLTADTPVDAGYVAVHGIAGQ